MTTGPAVPGTHTVAARHPIRVDTDGDFALDDLLSMPGVTPARSISVAEAAKHAAPTEGDAVLLRRIETSGLFRPPVREHLAALTPTVGAAWRALATRWTDLSRSCGDLRFLNAACKLTGAVWLHHQRSSGAWREPGLTGQLAAVGHLLNGATDQVRRRLAHRVLLAEPETSGGEALRTAQLTSQSRARIVVLASTGSRSAGRLVTAATAAGLPTAAVCWYSPTPTGPAVSSNYSSAWYPPAPPDLAPPAAVPESVPLTPRPSPGTR